MVGSITKSQSYTNVDSNCLTTLKWLWTTKSITQNPNEMYPQIFSSALSPKCPQLLIPYNVRVSMIEEDWRDSSFSSFANITGIWPCEYIIRDALLPRLWKGFTWMKKLKLKLHQFMANLLLQISIIEWRSELVSELPAWF